jgi:hypothetical protein
MRCTPSSCTSSLCMSLPCTAPPAAGLALAPALPHCSRARPNRVRSWPASCLAYTTRILLARCHATTAAPPASAPCACTASRSRVHAPAPPPAAPPRVTAPPTLARALAPEPPARRLPRAPHLRRAHVPTPALLAPRPLGRCRAPAPSRAARCSRACATRPRSARSTRAAAACRSCAYRAPLAALRPPCRRLGLAPARVRRARAEARCCLVEERERGRKEAFGWSCRRGEKKRGARITESRGERQMEFPKDLCAI